MWFDFILSNISFLITTVNNLQLLIIKFLGQNFQNSYHILNPAHVLQNKDNNKVSTLVWKFNIYVRELY